MSYLAMRDSAALMLPARCSTRTAASHSSAVCGFFNRACMHCQQRVRAWHMGVSAGYLVPCSQLRRKCVQLR